MILNKNMQKLLSRLVFCSEETDSAAVYLLKYDNLGFGIWIFSPKREDTIMNTTSFYFSQKRKDEEEAKRKEQEEQQQQNEDEEVSIVTARICVTVQWKFPLTNHTYEHLPTGRS